MGLLKRIESTSNGILNPTAASPNPATIPPAPQETTFRRQVTPPQDTTRSGFKDVKARVQAKVIAELDPKNDLNDDTQLRHSVQLLFDQVIEQEGIILTRIERQKLFDEVYAEIRGFGPIEPFLQDPNITEVMVNGPKSVYVESQGKIRKTDAEFDDDDHVMRIIDRIVAPLGRHIDESSPMVDARLPDGSRVNAIIAPLSLVGPCITIRKFSRRPLTVDDLIRFGSMTPELAEFLQACVKARLNIIVSGGTGSGKTTLLNVLSGFIPSDERIVTIEDAAELQLRQDHVVRLEARPPNIEGKGAVRIRDLVINALRMRPDRIVVGECRGSEALDMLQAMNTGHDGSLTTGHANSPRDMLARLETMVLMAGMDLPLRAIREQIASAIDLIVQQARMRDGSRRIVNVTEVQGMEGDVIVLQDIFVFEQMGEEGGKILGHLRPTGIRPKFMTKLEEANLHLPPSVFGISERFF
ncbi:MAG: CpaF family protein [Chloroflexota bacterium]|jgi:pilus assembly protein CpaF